MSRKSKLDKTLSKIRPEFNVFRIRCPICMKLNHRSKMHTTLYNLQYHLATDHSSDDEISSGISVDSVKNVISQIARAIEWRMILN